MGHDMITRAEAHPLQHGPQGRCGTNKAIVQEIDMREMPGTRQMPAAGTVARVFSGKLCARTGVEHMSVIRKLTLEGLPID